MSTLYTQTVKFGISDGPSFEGKKTSPPTEVNDAPRIYNQAACLHNATTTLDASGFTVANLLALGFKMAVSRVQTGTPTAEQLAAAAVTIKLVGAQGSAVDYTIALKDGESASFVDIPTALDSNASAITVEGDAHVDCEIYGILLVSA